uniref:Protein ENHANCED DISEASE RESISTANCE 2 C-terminal domain-containing protein n=1 Tax=Ditylum brightwellii TaxID=49249 RepID=A0A7S2EV63_9STRA
MDCVRQGEEDGDLWNVVEERVPQLLVIHIQVPYEHPNVFKATKDGKGGEVTLYLKPSKRFLQELSGQRPKTPATKLFVNWCATCETDKTMRSRFKCMASVRNIEKHNLGMVKSYNGKPVLVTESGCAKWGVTEDGGVNYLEMSANVHAWSFMAKKGFVSLIPKFQEISLDVGITIEAKDDDEMPECILAAVCMNSMDCMNVPSIPTSLRSRPTPVECRTR